MRIAVVSDIHGNALALDAVLEDCRAQGAEAYWLLGDYAAIGPEPNEAVERVAGLPQARFLRGNTDRYVVTGEGPPPHLAAVRADPDLIPTFAGIAASFAWTRGYVTAGGWLEWLTDLPLETRVEAPDGTRILAVHASPGTDDGEGVHPGRSDADLRALIEGAAADVILVGHTHAPMVRRLGEVVLVNPGSVANPRTDDVRASWALLELTDAGVEVRHRRVAYDTAEFEARVHRSRHPSGAFILGYLRGEQRVSPPHGDHAPLPADGVTRVSAGGR